LKSTFSNRTDTARNTAARQSSGASTRSILYPSWLKEFTSLKEKKYSYIYSIPSFPRFRNQIDKFTICRRRSGVTCWSYGDDELEEVKWAGC
jgi:hypothetical protein